MDFTGIKVSTQACYAIQRGHANIVLLSKDPAGIKALLDSLRSSGAFTLENSPGSNERSNGAPQDAADATSQLQPRSNIGTSSTPTSSISGQISSLLSRLESKSSSPHHPTTSSYQPSSSSSVGNSSSSSLGSGAHTTNLRDMTFSQTIPYIGRLLENPSVSAALRKVGGLDSVLWC
jgi:hypothetical protein